MHSLFTNPHKAPIGGFWLVLTDGERQFRVPQTGTADHFDHLVALVSAQIANARIQIEGSTRDFTAKSICLRDPEFCKPGGSAGPQPLAQGAVAAQRGGERVGGCRSCGGSRVL